MTETTIRVLDHGYVTLRNIAGPTRRIDQAFDAHDRDPANSARMSFGQSDKDRPVEADLKLNDYLLRNRHTTPFEMIEVWLEMKLPIFVARQFVRHRTAVINEISGRYVELPAEWYVPEDRHVGVRPDSMKQGRALWDWSELDAAEKLRAVGFCAVLDRECAASYTAYSSAIGEGIPPEVARNLLHLNHYTVWLWKQDLHNLMGFLSLRADGHAQWEAQQYANAIIDLLRPHLPHSMDLFDKYRRSGA